MTFRSKSLLQRSEDLRRNPEGSTPASSPAQMENGERAEVAEIEELPEQAAPETEEEAEAAAPVVEENRAESPDPSLDSVDEIIRVLRAGKPLPVQEGSLETQPSPQGAPASLPAPPDSEESRAGTGEVELSPPEVEKVEEEEDLEPEEAETSLPGPAEEEEEASDRSEIDQYLAEFRAERTRPAPAAPTDRPTIDDLFEDFFRAERTARKRRPSGKIAETPPEVSLPDELQADSMEAGKECKPPYQEEKNNGVVSDILLQEEKAVENTPPHLGALYLSGIAYVLASIRAVREGDFPDLNRGRDLVREIAFSLQKDSDLLMAATWREQDFSISAHSTNVAIFSIRTAQTMSADDALQLRVGLASLLHEVGTVRLPQRLTQSERALSSEELLGLRRRPTFSSQLLAEVDASCRWLPEIVGQVYEREDGSGFPLGLKGNEIREEAQLAGLVDFFDACIHKRPYRKALTGYQTLFELTTHHSSAFPERMVKALISTLSLYPFNEYVVLNSGEIGRVVEVHRKNLSRPTVELLFSETGEPLSARRLLDLTEDSSCYISRAITADALPGR